MSGQLDQILATEGSGAGATGTSGASSSGTPSADSAASGASASTAGAAAAGSATGAAGSAAASGGYDPSIISKLREVRTHLDAFQEASGDPTPHFDAIEKIIDSALNGGSASGSVGTTGSSTATTGTTGDSSAGGVSITRAQLEEIRQHVEKLRAASNAAAGQK